MGELLSKPTPKVELPSGRVSVGGRVIKLVFTGETTVGAGAGKEFLSEAGSRTSGPVEPVDLEGEAAGEMSLNSVPDYLTHAPTYAVEGETVIIDVQELKQYLAQGGDVKNLAEEEIEALIVDPDFMDITTTLESRILIQLEAAVAAHEGRRALNAGQSRSLGVIATKTT